MHEFFGKMVFMMVIWVILTIGSNWLHEGRFDWMGVLTILPVISIMWVVWDLIDGFFGWSAPQFPVLEAVFGRTDTLPFWANNILSQDEIDGMSHQWSDALPFLIVVLARVFFGLNGWFRWMVILTVPWSQLDYEFDWKTPWWLFAIVTGIITVEWNRLKEERQDRLWWRDWVAKRKEIVKEIEELEEDWVAKRKEFEEEERCMDKIRRIRRGGKARSAPKRSRKKAKKKIEK